MILGYKKLFPWKEPTDFKRKIQDGIKKHTIRADVKERWHVGMKIQHAHGIRTKYYEQFFEGVCKSVQTIEIQWCGNIANVFIDHLFTGRYFKKQNCCTSSEIRQLAINDGFDSFDDFFKWFDKDFTGKIIHWTDTRY